MVRALHLVGERFGVDGGRLGVGHLEHRRDAAHHGGVRAGLQIFLVGEARLAHVHVAVDDARQHVQAAAIDDLGGGAGQLADPGDAAAGNGDITDAFAVVIDDRAALEDQVVAFRHNNPPIPIPGLEGTASAAYVRREPEAIGIA